MSVLLSVVAVTAMLASVGANDPLEPVRMPRHVKVLPIFFVPKDVPEPTDSQTKLFMQHLAWTQARYRELLPGHVTFGIASHKPLVYKSQHMLGFYKGQSDAGASEIAGELLPFLKCTQRNCPYILLTVIMNPIDDWPGGGAQPLNGGFNTGGSIVVLPSRGLEPDAFMQSTLQHELGHSFGLPHVDVYDYDMRRNDSLMSYNPNHHTHGLTPSPTPGKLIPEDLRGLALNQRVFPGLTFEAARDVPHGYRIASRIITLGPMVIPGQLAAVQFSTESGEADGSAVANLKIGELVPLTEGAKPAFEPEAMWRSMPASSGWASFEALMPLDVPLTRVSLHTMPLDGPDSARRVRISVRAADGQYHKVAERLLKTSDDVVRFRANSGRQWRFEFEVGAGKAVVVRGVEFFSGREQLLPPLLPFHKSRR